MAGGCANEVLPFADSRHSPPGRSIGVSEEKLSVFPHEPPGHPLASCHLPFVPACGGLPKNNLFHNPFVNRDVFYSLMLISQDASGAMVWSLAPTDSPNASSVKPMPTPPTLAPFPCPGSCFTHITLTHFSHPRSRSLAHKIDLWDLQRVLGPDPGVFRRPRRV